MPPHRLLPLSFLLLLLGCHHHRGLNMPGSLSHLGQQPAPPPAARSAAPAPPPKRPKAPRSAGQAVALAAGQLLGQGSLQVGGIGYRFDCSGFIEAAYAAAGRPVRGSSRDLHELASMSGVLHERAIPELGDVAFFDDTYDRNRNRRRDDTLSHVGIVEAVDEHGTITVIHLGNKGITRMSMNLQRPNDNTVNSVLRSAGDRDGGPVLSGQLWRAFGSLWAVPPAALSANAPLPPPSADPDLLLPI